MDKAMSKFIIYLNQLLDEVSKKTIYLADEKLSKDQEFLKMLSVCNHFRISIEKSGAFVGKLDRIMQENLSSDEKTKISLIEEILKHISFVNDKYLANYDLISDLLLDSSLNRKEMFSVFKEIMKKDMTIMERDSDDKISLFAPEINDQLFESYINSGDYRRLINADERELSREDLDFKLRIIQLKEIHKKLKDCFLSELTHIRTYYFAKEKTYNESDIEKIIEAFRNIGINTTLCQVFEELLKQELEKRKEKNKPISSSMSTRNVEESKLSMQEYNNIIKEIEEYYDIQNQKRIRPLTLEEIIYLVSLLYKANFNEKEIKKCVMTINKDRLCAYSNWLTEFIAYQEKIAFSKNAFIKEDYETIKSYLKELVQIQDQESYLFWEEEIEEIYKVIFNELWKECDYELEEGQKLSRINSIK